MRWTLLLPLLMMLSLSLSLGGPPQEPVPLFRLTQQGPWESRGSYTTSDSPCEGFPVGATVLTLVNRSLERLPACLPRTLRSLDGSHNLLRALSTPELGGLQELRELTLRHNRISALRWGGGAPARLLALDLSHNALAALPPCTGPALHSLRMLTLAGNPLRELQPRAFACLPELQLLNLSCSALGRGARGSIADGAFTREDGQPLVTLEVLDLSGTHLEQVESGWIRDLPNLKSLYLRKMPRLKTLEGDIFKMTPNLKQLDCQESPALTSVHTQIFQDTPCLQLLLFQKAADTMCAPAAGSKSSFSGPLSLSQLSGVCTLDQNTTLLASNPTSFNHSAYAPWTQDPFTGWNTGLSAQPGEGEQNITKAPSYPVASLTQGAWVHGDTSEENARFTIDSMAGYSPSRAPPRADSIAGGEQLEQAATRVLEPRISPASTTLASKYLGPLPTSPNPMSMSQAIHKALHTNPSEDEIPILLLDDYSEEEAAQEQVRAPRQDVSCDYHPCKHLQTPCAELQKRLRCRCPGLSGEDTVPDPPKLQEASEMTDTSMLIHWCAPNSVVLWYQIRYSAEGGSGNQSVVGNIYATARQHPLYKLSPGTTYRVCVLAANRAGVSQPQTSGWRRSCATFTTKPSSLIIFWVLCTSCGLLLVSTLVLSVCLCRRCWKPPRQGYDTHLVAFKNPASIEGIAQW
ncbi:leucine-rich repeat neuronal protein 4 [Nannospalax galili]|nr:leucine-rich repeat neuronal protein 4 [Nannospalax galili]